ncbi:30S ribosomal protein S13 [Candidatus Woesearchaeota archaeon]|nr:30S ribosomal protein S13 [Candidatus Woesearchaeota archaeon]
MTEHFRNIVRILNTDIDGNRKVFIALKKIRGIGFIFSNAICNHFDIDKNMKIGNLTEDNIKNIEMLVENPAPLPIWLLNRRKDFDTGKDIHVTTSKLRLSFESDIKKLKKTKSYRGLRHAWGLPVRGQRTRGNFRRGKSVGVTKKATKIAQAAAGKPAKPTKPAKTEKGAKK